MQIVASYTVYIELFVFQHRHLLVCESDIQQYSDKQYNCPKSVTVHTDWIILMPNADDDNRIDFNNAVINLTIPANSTVFDIQATDIIVADNVNEAEEEFLLVLELNTDEVTFDEEGGILVVTILDSNRK